MPALHTTYDNVCILQVLETLQAKESGQSGLPDAASIISEKNYVMVWDVMA